MYPLCSIVGPTPKQNVPYSMQSMSSKNITIVSNKLNQLGKETDFLSHKQT